MHVTNDLATRIEIAQHGRVAQLNRLVNSNRAAGEIVTPPSITLPWIFENAEIFLPELNHQFVIVIYSYIIQQVNRSSVRLLLNEQISLQVIVTVKGFTARTCGLTAPSSGLESVR